jgi:RNA polymerase sigma factor (sigma-70 family)
LHKLLASYSPKLRDIWLTVHRKDQGHQGDCYEARAVLYLPTGTLAAEADDKDPETDLDLVADALAAKIERHNRRVRKDTVTKGKVGQRADLNAISPLLQRDAERGRKDEFFRLLRPQLRFLKDHARRELMILEIDGTLHRGEVTVSDLLDEVTLRAWQRFAQRPQHQPLDLWLTNLLHESLEQLIKQEPRPHVSLEVKHEMAPPGDVPPMEEKQEKEEKEWWDELDPFEEKVELEDVLLDSQGTEPWDELESDEQWERLLSLIGELPDIQRQTLLLHVLENYNTAEIAMLQNRPENEVMADIEAARRTLRDLLLAAGIVRESGNLTTALASPGNSDGK